MYRPIEFTRSHVKIHNIHILTIFMEIWTLNPIGQLGILLRYERKVSSHVAEQKSLHFIVRNWIPTMPQPSFSGSQESKISHALRLGGVAYTLKCQSETSQSLVSVTSCMWKRTDCTLLWVLLHNVTLHEEQVEKMWRLASWGVFASEGVRTGQDQVAENIRVAGGITIILD